MYILDDSTEEKIRKIIEHDGYTEEQIDTIEIAARKAAGLVEMGQ